MERRVRNGRSVSRILVADNRIVTTCIALINIVDILFHHGRPHFILADHGSKHYIYNSIIRRKALIKIPP